MRIAAGDYYDGKCSHRQAAELHDEGGWLSLRSGRDHLIEGTALAEVEISPRIGNTPRYLTFPGGATFESGDNDAIDDLLQRHQHEGRARLVHRLESRLPYIVIALVLVIGFVWGGIRWGIPAMAETAAYSLPASASDWIGEGVLALLDRQVFTPSELSAERQERIQARFAPIVEDYREGFEIEVIFRHGGKIGANAMALPSGTIIFTDELVALAENDEELVAILAHEVGHVIKRHGLRQALQTSALGILVVTVTGDISSLSSIVTTIPVILTQLGYSREFEREADHFALEVLQAQGITPSRFASILQRIEQSALCQAAETEEGEQGADCQEADAASEEDGMSGYLSTHPPTDERIRDFL